MTTIRVLIVDGHPATREGLHVALDLAKDVLIVGEADSCETAIEGAGELTPDIVFMDVDTPGVGSIEATKAIKQASPETRVILFMGKESQDAMSEAIQAGVSGFLLRDADADELVNAARLALEGRAYLDASLAAAYIAEVQRSGGRIESPPLSKREKEIFQKVAYGATDQEVAHDLGISPLTAKTIRERIFERLYGNDRARVIAAKAHSSRRSDQGA